MMIINSRVANFEILYLSFFVGLFLSFSLFISQEKISLRPWLRKKKKKFSEIFLQKRKKVIQGSQSLVLVFVKSVPRLLVILPVPRLNLQSVAHPEILQTSVGQNQYNRNRFLLFHIQAAAFTFNAEFNSYAMFHVEY